MKRLFTALIATVFLFSCTDEKKADKPPANVEATKAAATVAYPYMADYSSDFSIGNPQHSKMVLDLYKMWEDGKIDEMRPLLADSVFIDITDGMKFNNTVDSFVNFAKQVRATYKLTKPVFDKWMPVHSNDKNEDFVLVWSRDYSTNTDGKMDSLRVHAYFLVQNNKVRGWSEFQQKLAPEPPPVKK